MFALSKILFQEALREEDIFLNSLLEARSAAALRCHPSDTAPHDDP